MLHRTQRTPLGVLFEGTPQTDHRRKAMRDQTTKGEAVKHILAVPILVAVLMMSAPTNAHADVDQTREFDQASGGVLLAQVSTPTPAAGNPPATATEPTAADLKTEAVGRVGPVDAAMALVKKLKKALDDYKAERAKSKNDGTSTTGPLLTFLIAIGAAMVTAGQLVVAWRKKREAA